MKFIAVLLTFYTVFAQNYSQIIEEIVCSLPTELTERASFLGGNVRLAFHDVAGGDVKSNGCFDEKEDANKGLDEYSDNLEPIFQRHKGELSRADIWVLAAHVSIYVAGGPAMPFTHGRQDCKPKNAPSDVGFLPTTTMTFQQVMAIMHTRMGLTPQEIVALMGAHCLGGSELENSGMEGNQVTHNNKWTNAYFKDTTTLLWQRSNKFGADKPIWINSKQQLRFNTDLQLTVNISKPSCQKVGPSGAHKGCPYNALTNPHFQKYAVNEALWKRDFSAAFQKLTNIGYQNLPSVTLPYKRRAVLNHLPCPATLPPTTKPKPKSKDSPKPKPK
jgi:catalase (peroxidase I)